MRLIDADVLIDDLKHDVAMDQDSLDYEKLTDSNRENIQFDKDCKQNAIDLLQHAPTIEERKKGKWIDAVLPNDNGGLPVQVCDQCNTFFPLAYTGGGHRFCPKCGAKMEYGAYGI